MSKLKRLASLLIGAFCLTPTAMAQTDPVAALPMDLATSAYGSLMEERAALVTQLETVQAHITAFNGRCGQVRRDDGATVQDCQTSQQAILQEVRDYRAALAAYEARLAAAPRGRQFIASGNGLIGGTRWRVGYNVPPNSSPEMRAHAREMLRDQARLAGVPYDEAVDFDRYNFVIGIATWTDAWRDLFLRAATEDQWFSGLSVEHQELYNSLRGRQFEELGCHSNGAMICLRALQSDDVRAGNVVLYGPQLTPATLAMWNELLASHRIQSLQILVNQNDPVTPAAMLYSLRSVASPYEALARTGMFFNSGDLVNALQTMSPEARVQAFPCGRRPTLDCHDMSVYRENRNQAESER